ncbi:MAG: beta-propeller fold lactonase family protein [Candidatus Sulfotelmatobacter sp.]
MSFRRLNRIAATVLATMVTMSCGQVYRPVVIPISTTPPNTQNFHAVFVLSSNTAFNVGAAFQIDVSGDSNIGQVSLGVNPTHAAILPTNSRVFVASAGANLCAGDTDLVTAFVPANDSSAGSGLGGAAIFSFPNVGPGTQNSTITAISEVGNLVTVTLNAPLSGAAVGGFVTLTNVVIPGGGTNALSYNGCYAVTSVAGSTIQYVNPTPGLAATTGGAAATPAFCSYFPDYVGTTQNTSVFVANYGAENDPNCSHASTDSVALLSTTSNTITNIQYLPAGTHPVALAETPNQQFLYVLEQGTDSVAVLSPVDLSSMTATPIAVGKQPAWIAVRPDGQRVYVVTEGDGQLYTIRTDTNTVVANQPVGGAGANYVLYDSPRNRLYVTNPTAGAVYVFDATTDPPTPVLSGTVSIPAPPPCATAAAGSCGPVTPSGVTTLLDGSRFYVASYVTVPTGVACLDGTVTAAGCVIPQVTVFDAESLTVKSTVFPLFVNGTATSGFAAAPNAACLPAAPPASYVPAAAMPRFRIFAASAEDGSHVYASICDAGMIADIDTSTSSISYTGTNTPDSLVSDIAAPFGAAGIGSNGQPLPQNPTFMLTGQ